MKQYYNIVYTFQSYVSKYLHIFSRMGIKTYNPVELNLQTWKE